MNQFLPQLFLPLNVSLMLAVFGLWRRRPRWVAAAILLLVVSSHPFTAWFAMRSAEGWAQRRPAATVAAADAIVVLSAGRGVAPGPEATHEWNDANRFFGGLELFRAEKARRLVFTGAVSGSDQTRESEGAMLRHLAIALGVKADSILVTGSVQNTADEARETRAALSETFLERPRILLVTSAFHMPRAMEQFAREGFDVDPFPVGFATAGRFRLTWTRILPSAGALLGTQTALREFYGRAFYRVATRF